MHLGKNNRRSKYYMHGKELNEVRSERDLGIMVSEDLKVSNQCTQAVGKANRMLSMNKRTVRSRRAEVLIPLYKSLVRPHLEYCSAAWSPYYQKDKAALERIQHRFTRFIPGMSSKEYSVCLES